MNKYCIRLKVSVSLSPWWWWWWWCWAQHSVLSRLDLAPFRQSGQSDTTHRSRHKNSTKSTNKILELTKMWMPWFLVPIHSLKVLKICSTGGSPFFLSQNQSDTLWFPIGFQLIKISRSSDQQQRMDGIDTYWNKRNMVSRIREIHYKGWLVGSTIHQMPNERYRST